MTRITLFHMMQTINNIMEKIKILELTTDCLGQQVNMNQKLIRELYNQLNELKGGSDKMGKIILKKAIQRKQGYLYYVDGDGNVCEAKMSRGRKKKKKK